MHGNLLHPVAAISWSWSMTSERLPATARCRNERLGSQRRARRDETIVACGELLTERRRHLESKDIEIV